MDHIGNLFSRLKTAFSDLESKKEIITTSCATIAGIKLTPEQINIDSKIIRLDISPAAKSALFMKKTEILADLKEKMKVELTDIR